MKIRIVSPADITTKEKSGMFDLMREGYLNVLNHEMLTHLDQKTHVFLVYDDADQLVGFSTIAVRRQSGKDGDISLVFSGDTIVKKEFWGKSKLQYALKHYVQSVDGGRAIYVLASQHPRTFFLIRAMFSNEVSPLKRGVIYNYHYDELTELFGRAFPEFHIVSKNRSFFLMSTYCVNDNIVGFNNGTYADRRFRSYETVNPYWRSGAELLSFYSVNH